MTRSEYQTSSPAAHGGLGVDQYVQFTSPIRRYSDLLAHIQLRAFLSGHPPPYESYDGSLSSILLSVSKNARVLKRLERETERYWSSCYFAEQMARDPQRTWRAVLLGWHRRHNGSTYYTYSVGVVYLSEVGHECIAFVDDASGMKPGDVMRVRCTEADPALGQVKLVQHSAPLLA